MTGSFQNIDLEHVDCMLCSSSESVEAGQAESHGVVFAYRLCADCGLKYMSPRPTKAWYEAHYADHFWEYKEAHRSWRDIDKNWRFQDLLKRGKSGRQRRQARRLEYLIPLLQQNASIGANSKVLDIGCAYGAIGAGFMERLGCEVWGVEPNAAARKIAEQENGINILCHTAEEISTAASDRHQFDLVLMSNVLENVLSPKDVLETIPGILGPEGRLCIHMPNFYYYDAMNPYHPYVYSPATLTRLQAVCGLEVLQTIACAPQNSEVRNTAAFEQNDRFVTTLASANAEFVSEKEEIDTGKILQEQRLSLEFEEASKKRANSFMRWFA